MKIIITSVLLLVSGLVFADNGLVKKQSPYSPAETLDRLEKVLMAKGIKVFARINHSANAKGVGLVLRPTELLIFGNPKLGTHLINGNQTVGIDLPMKVLAWQDDNFQTWVAYNDPRYIVGRHEVGNREAIVTKMQGALNKLTNKAIEK